MNYRISLLRLFVYCFIYKSILCFILSNIYCILKYLYSVDCNLELLSRYVKSLCL